MDIDRVNRAYAKFVELINGETEGMDHEERAVLLDMIADQMESLLGEIEGNIGDEDGWE